MFIAETAYAQTFAQFITEVQKARDSTAKSVIVQKFLSENSVPAIEGDSVHFLYWGKGNLAAVPGEMNGWNPSKAMMDRVPRTNLWFRTYRIPSSGRVEYKIWVDSAWTLDPRNAREAQGGYGENSDLWMSQYTPPASIEFHPAIPRGKIDTIWFSSRTLGRMHPVFVYTPPNVSGESELPTVFVADGGEYLSLAKMHNVLNNLLAERRIRPVLGVFVDPRTDLHDASSSKRMTDYAASEPFLDFLESELTPFLQTKYPLATSPGKRLILGASMGGLIATYAVLQRPDFVLNCAAQSPAYFQADSAVVKLAKRAGNPKAHFYIDTGTLHDTQIEARLVRTILEDRGAKIRYEEVPEGHNWSNWRARLSVILEHFFPAR